MNMCFLYSAKGVWMHILNSVSLSTCSQKGRVAECATPKYVSVAFWLPWVIGTWKTAKVERELLWTPLSTKRQSFKRNSVAASPLPLLSSTRQNWLLPQERGLEVDTTPSWTSSQTILSPISSSKDPLTSPKNHLLSPFPLLHFPYLNGIYEI